MVQWKKEKRQTEKLEMKENGKCVSVCVPLTSTGSRGHLFHVGPTPENTASAAPPAGRRSLRSSVTFVCLARKIYP